MTSLLLTYRLQLHRTLLTLGHQRCTSWKSFTLTDPLTVEVKKSIETKWRGRVYGYGSPTEEQLRMNKDQGSIQSKDKAYVLSMFPYPSGKLHLGHLRIYTLSDVLARYHRLKGKDVVHPIGWDAFGLPAENAARDNQVEPEAWTRSNIDYMKQQLQRMGCSFDWDRELTTCDPSYYKWTQWLFSKLWETGLAYKKKGYVFWDPIDKTVLAEEQVDCEMRSWRSGAKVERRLLDQWYIRTTVFAKALSDCLNDNSLRYGWRDIVDMQKNWIGPIQGYFTDCPILTNSPSKEYLRLWFSSPDVLDKAQFVILNPNQYLAHLPQRDLKEFPNGVKQINAFIQNPKTGQPLPIFYSSSTPLPLVPESADCRVNERLSQDLYSELAQNENQISQIQDVLSSAEVSCRNFDKSVMKGFTYFPSSLKLRDWLISRQRKWGTPIPTVTCIECGHDTLVNSNRYPITPTKQYPVCHNYINTSSTPCSNCGSPKTKPESDTLDTFFDSTWYFLRYLDPRNESQLFDPVKVAPWIPVRTYVGGKEHATLHLYYARFMTHFLHSLGLVPEKEPFKVLVPVGVVMGETYLTKERKYLHPNEVERVDSNKFVEKSSQSPVISTWEKMSKSKHNGIDTDLMLDEYGIDSMRLLSMADVAPQSIRKWTSQSFDAYLKFQSKLWKTVGDFVEAKECEEEHILQFIDEFEWNKIEEELFDARNYHLKTISNSMEVTSQISVVITKIHGILTALRKIPKAAIKDSFEFERALGTVLITLYPVMPAFCAQLWQYFRDVANLSYSEFDLENEIWCQKWPEVDPNYKLELTVLIRSEEVDVIKVERQNLDNLDAVVALELALESEKVMSHVARESVQVLFFNVEPGYRATINLKDPNFAPIEKVKKKPKVKPPKIENKIGNN